MHTVPAARFQVPWVVPVVFLVTAGLGQLAFRTPFPHPHVLVAVALGFGAAAAAFARRSHRPAVNVVYLGLELLAISLVAWASGGLRSPLLGLYLVFILECSIAYGQPWGVLSALLAAICAELTQLALNGGVFFPNAGAELDLSRLMASYVFFSLAGLLTSVQSDLMNRRQEIDARKQAQRQADEALERFQMNVAREIQQTLLPLEKPASEEWDSHWLVRPQLAVGGDFVQFFEAGNAVGCVVADVTGKGVPAALLTGSLHQMVLRYGHLSPEVAMARINALLVESTPPGFFVSMIIVKLWPDGEVTFANAGHPYPLLLRSGGTVEAWESSNLPAGLQCDIEYTLHRRRLEPGETLLLYTDGLSDMWVNDREQLSDAGIQSLLQSGGRDALDNVATRLLEPLETGRQVDDITLLLLRRRVLVGTVPQPVSSGRQRCPDATARP